MTRIARPSHKKMRPVPGTAVFAKARKNTAYQKAFDGMEDEFTLLSTLIKARVDAGMTQEQVASRMETSQSNVARLETGKVEPSIKTLKRYARATGHRLKISFEPQRT